MSHRRWPKIGCYSAFKAKLIQITFSQKFDAINSKFSADNFDFIIKLDPSPPQKKKRKKFWGTHIWPKFFGKAELNQNPRFNTPIYLVFTLLNLASVAKWIFFISFTQSSAEWYSDDISTYLIEKNCLVTWMDQKPLISKCKTRISTKPRYVGTTEKPQKSEARGG